MYVEWWMVAFFKSICVFACPYVTFFKLIKRILSACKGRICSSQVLCIEEIEGVCAWWHGDLDYPIAFQGFTVQFQTLDFSIRFWREAVSDREGLDDWKMGRVRLAFILDFLFFPLIPFLLFLPSSLWFSFFVTDFPIRFWREGMRCWGGLSSWKFWERGWSKIDFFSDFLPCPRQPEPWEGGTE